jgi:hypothetical protein
LRRSGTISVQTGNTDLCSFTGMGKSMAGAAAQQSGPRVATWLQVATYSVSTASMSNAAAMSARV